jgi:hypothetical protein
VIVLVKVELSGFVNVKVTVAPFTWGSIDPETVIKFPLGICVLKDSMEI